MAKRDSNLNPVRKSRGLRGTTTDVADYESWSEGSLKRAIVAASRTGGALRFGYTSDGGAYAIGIYGDGAPYTHYVKPGDDSDAVCEDIVELFETIRDSLQSGEKAEK